ncbi:MAG TPA: T9SS type A sorting domain-containing protein, partial [Terriglobia bacterium]|nr:T9SS type A sorting domain-containing protein [Terriglobia bacterium]
MGYAYMQEAPEYADYVSFNHCTFLNTVMYTLESSYWWNLSVTNCIFHNAYMVGDQPSGDGTNMTPGGGTVNIDSVAGLSFTVPFTDDRTAAPNLQRHILFSNCSYSHDSWLYDYIANNPYNQTLSSDSSKIHRMPMMSTKTYHFFVDSTAGQKNFPYMWEANLLPLDTMSTTYNRPVSYSATYDPQFYLPPTNIDSIKGFLLGRWYNGFNINWAFNPQDDVNQIWPMNEDLSYTNTTIKTAAMGGYPLGDLYRWWGPLSASGEDHYTPWKAQAATEHSQISNWLANGLVTGVSKVEPNLPKKFDLGQNFPNPFNPTTQIVYSVPRKGVVSLKVYNLLGQEVATLFEGERQPGTYNVRFDAHQLS